MTAVSAEGTSPNLAFRSPRLRLAGSTVVGGLIVLLLVLMAVAPGLLPGRDVSGLDVANQYAPPSSAHWFGTDEVGRDIFTRIVEGTRYSLSMALSIVVIAAILGTLLGLVAGYAGGWVDQLIMRSTDIFFSLPTFVVAMALSVVLGRGMVSLVFALSVVWWPTYARLVRGMVLAIKERPHVRSARAIGASNSRILRKHIVPFMTQELVVRSTQDVGYAIVAVSSLSFIGVGAQPPTPEWGLLLFSARNSITISWSYPLFPGLMIVLATVGFALLGDGLSGGGSARRRRSGRRGSK
ncbi:MAG: ABC transporter permease [Geodermatophilaceae bacterium]